MMYQFIFTQYAEKKFKKLEHSVQERIIQKLKQIKNHSNVFSLFVTLQDFEPATHRLRVGASPLAESPARDSALRKKEVRLKL